MVLLPQSITTNGNNEPTATTTETSRFVEDVDSACSTPYVSAPSSPGRGPLSAYFFSAPTSPMHFMLSSSPATRHHHPPDSSDTSSFEFEFSSRFSSSSSVAVGFVRSADELFLNGQIRPMKLSSHLQRPQILAPLMDLNIEEEEEEDGEGIDSFESVKRGRDPKLRSRSLHRKARSLSPLRNVPEFKWREGDGTSREKHILELQDLEKSKQTEETATSSETTPSGSASSSRSSSSGRNSKKWIFLKDLLYRSKSEGRANGKDKFWSTISLSPSKEKKHASLESQKEKHKQKQEARKKGRPANASTVAPAKRRVPSASAHELHYTANRAQAEEMKKRTLLPYRQGLFGCLGFSSKGYGALARSLNPVSSR
ncbi:DUF1645 domain-containing protein [Cephalotus follicularis]|uniref:DUF1645 domain-containing protein n=1 Tax=Cephalotus follicularis TaxID=3775 RepID=A0A1Q3D2U7_CEPFO|nr:DUF1645 domain-containing protein [Cephalotus follicularis]